MTAIERALPVRIVMATAAALSLVAAPNAVSAACPADVSPAGGDGVVNINDLLEVINHWGPCPAPCPPRCGTDIVPLVAGDCATNIDDLLEVINNWGACPCNPSGTWASAPPAAYQCAFTLVQFNIVQWTFSQGAGLSVSGAPVMMTGPAVNCSNGQAFSVTASIPGSCTETYTLSGTFTSPNSFTGTFTAAFTPPITGACFDCTNQQFNVTGTRLP